MKHEEIVSDYGNRGVVPKHCVRVSALTAPVTVPGTEPASGPRIELIRDGDSVKAIEVICSCGQRIRLSCVY